MSDIVTAAALLIAGLTTCLLIATLGGQFVDLGLAIVQLTALSVVIVGSLGVAAFTATRRKRQEDRS